MGHQHALFGKETLVSIKHAALGGEHVRKNIFMNKKCTFKTRRAERESRRLLHAEQKKDKETEGCTFKPKLISRSPNQREAVQLARSLATCVAFFTNAFIF